MKRHSPKNSVGLEMKYQENLFRSDRIEDLVAFYNSFDSSETVIEWMKNRPLGRADIKDTKGDKKCIVVIPTRDCSSELAVSCRDEIFRGLRIVFVESGPDPFFNF